jgi:hypothetical protein
MCRHYTITNNCTHSHEHLQMCHRGHHRGLHCTRQKGIAIKLDHFCPTCTTDITKYTGPNAQRILVTKVAHEMEQLTQAYWLAKSIEMPELLELLPDEYSKVPPFEGRLKRRDVRCLKRMELLVQVSVSKPETFAFFTPLQLLLHRTIEQAELNFLEDGIVGVMDEDLVSPWWMGYIRGTLTIKGWPPN